MNIETAATNLALNQTMGKDFIRMQVYTEASLDTYGDKWYTKMETNGRTMFNDPDVFGSHADLIAMIETIVDQRFKPKSPTSL